MPSAHSLITPIIHIPRPNPWDSPSSSEPPQPTPPVQKSPPSPEESEGWTFRKSDDGSSYILLSMTVRTNAEAVIPAQFRDLPVTTIGACAFKDCSDLTRVVLPASVEKIEFRAFAHCSSLTDITLSSGLKNIGAWAFHNCTALTTITLPEGVTRIGECAFADCTALTEITVPASVTTIGEMAFFSCRHLADIRYAGTAEQWNAIQKGPKWNEQTGSYIHPCNDDQIPKGRETARRRMQAIGRTLLPWLSASLPPMLAWIISLFTQSNTTAWMCFALSWSAFSLLRACTCSHTTPHLVLSLVTFLGAVILMLTNHPLLLLLVCLSSLLFTVFSSRLIEEFYEAVMLEYTVFPLGLITSAGLFLSSLVGWGVLIAVGILWGIGAVILTVLFSVSDTPIGICITPACFLLTIAGAVAGGDILFAMYPLWLVASVLLVFRAMNEDLFVSPDPDVAAFRIARVLLPLLSLVCLIARTIL